MTLALVFLSFAALCGVGVSYRPRAPGDDFDPGTRQRRWGAVLSILAGLSALVLLGIHPHSAVACVALLWSLALSGPLLCCLRWLGARWVLTFGGLSLLGAVVWAGLR